MEDDLDGIRANLVQNALEVLEPHQGLGALQTLIARWAQRASQVAYVARVNGVNVGTVIDDDIATRPGELDAGEVGELSDVGVTEKHVSVTSLAGVRRKLRSYQIHQSRNHKERPRNASRDEARLPCSVLAMRSAENQRHDTAKPLAAKSTNASRIGFGFRFSSRSAAMVGYVKTVNLTALSLNRVVGDTFKCSASVHAPS